MHPHTCRDLVPSITESVVASNGSKSSTCVDPSLLKKKPLSLFVAKAKTRKISGQKNQKFRSLASQKPMKAVLFRTGSVPVHVRSTPVSGSPRPSLSRSDSLSGDRASKVISLNFEANRRRSVIRRALSEAELSGGIGSFPARIPDGDWSRSVLLNRTATTFGASRPELGFSGGGFGKGRNSGGGGGDGGSGNRRDSRERG